MSKEKTAITPTREQDFPEWYQQVIKAADLAENSETRGCMVIKPWGYGIWELIQQQLDRRFKATGHQNAYFPMLIPLSYLEKEAEHAEGFATECAVVTHHRLEAVKDEETGKTKMLPTGELAEPYVIRPTSETIIGSAFARWVQSYRDLPLLINQWANVMRWEMRPRLFLRTAEFLWQEGHTAHESKDEAIVETRMIHRLYEEFLRDHLAIPVVPGEKSENERFPGADMTLTIEAMVQDRKAIQAGTSHYLGQNFSKAQNISFASREGGQEFAHTTSWGVSTRLIGTLIMAHSDDDGLMLPPRVATQQVVIIPVTPKEDTREAVLAACHALAETLSSTKSYHGDPIRAFVDARDLQGGQKKWEWVKKGRPHPDRDRPARHRIPQGLSAEARQGSDREVVHGQGGVHPNRTRHSPGNPRKHALPRAGISRCEHFRLQRSSCLRLALGQGEPRLAGDPMGGHPGGGGGAFQAAQDHHPLPAAGGCRAPGRLAFRCRRQMFPDRKTKQIRRSVGAELLEK